MANHAEKEWEWKGERYKVKPGQFVTSLKAIAEKCGDGVSIRNVRTALERFEKYEFLTNESTNRNRLITITNWEFYQSKEEEPTKQLTSNRQATDKQLTTNKNDKNDKNDKEDIITPLPPLLKDAIKDFMAMRKQAKKPMTDRAVELMLNKLEKLSGGNTKTKIAILEQSIVNGWTGVYPLKEEKIKEAANPFDELLRKELENEQSRNYSPYEDNKRLLPDVLPRE
jgi:hypothetical protein